MQSKRAVAKENGCGERSRTQNLELERLVFLGGLLLLIVGGSRLSPAVGVHLGRLLVSVHLRVVLAGGSGTSLFRRVLLKLQRQALGSLMGSLEVVRVRVGRLCLLRLELRLRPEGVCHGMCVCVREVVCGFPMCHRLLCLL